MDVAHESKLAQDVAYDLKLAQAIVYDGRLAPREVCGSYPRRLAGEMRFNAEEASRWIQNHTALARSMDMPFGKEGI